MLRPLVSLNDSPSMDIKNEINSIAEYFVDYLGTFIPSTSSSSKHTKMGPVGKALSKMRSGKRGESLIGEIVRVHEMTSTKRGDGGTAAISSEGFHSLTIAIKKMSELLDSVPFTTQNRVISEIDATVYYLLEARHQERIRLKWERFRDYLKSTYGNLDALKEAWQEPEMDWGKIPYPTEKYEGNSKIIADIKAFLELRKGDAPLKGHNGMDEEDNE